RKWIPFVIVAVATAASLAVFSRLPESMPTHWGGNGQVNGSSPRLFGAFIIPAILLLTAIMMRALPAIDPRRENYQKFVGAFDAIFISTMLLLLILHIAMLAVGLGYPVAMGRIAPVGVGLLLMVLGNVMPQARPNWFIGVRTPWTLSSDRVWERTHRLAGYVFVMAGFILAIIGLIGARSGPIMLAPAFVIGAAALSLVVYSYVEWRREGKGAGHSS
ncbi:MAG: SdpI family protein, partial [Gemmatimonadota bacterium]|nr:SdpI family protein [Gemmatimonadota bacterium]